MTTTTTSTINRTCTVVVVIAPLLLVAVLLLAVVEFFSRLIHLVGSVTKFSHFIILLFLNALDNQNICVALE